MLNLEEVTFGRWTVIGRGDNRNGKIYLKVRCECGNESEVRKCALTSGMSKSCGCLVSDRMKKQKYGFKHGFSPKYEKKDRLYITYGDMKQRCYNENNKRYARYGGRGITICDEWKTFEAFREWALNNGYADNLTIERINPDKNYEPNNCEWITLSENSRRNMISIPRENGKLIRRII
jgi:hypothetical protein